MKRKDIAKQVEELEESNRILRRNFEEKRDRNTVLSQLSEAQARYIEDLESLLLHGHVVDRNPTMVFVGGGGGGGGAASQGGGGGGAMR